MVMAFSSKEELKSFLKRIPHSETFLRIAKEDGDRFLAGNEELSIKQVKELMEEKSK